MNYNHDRLLLLMPSSGFAPQGGYEAPQFRDGLNGKGRAKVLHGILNSCAI